MGLDIYVITAIGIVCGTCLGTSMVLVSVYSVADDSDDSPVWQLMGACSIGIIMYMLIVNICSCRGAQIGFEIA